MRRENVMDAEYHSGKEPAHSDSDSGSGSGGFNHLAPPISAIGDVEVGDMSFHTAREASDSSAAYESSSSSSSSSAGFEDFDDGFVDDDEVVVSAKHIKFDESKDLDFPADDLQEGDEELRSYGSDWKQPSPLSRSLDAPVSSLAANALDTANAASPYPQQQGDLASEEPFNDGDGSSVRSSPSIDIIHRSALYSYGENDITQSELQQISEYSRGVSDVKNNLLAIERDIPRTFPTLGFFHDGGQMEQSLRRVLRAYACYKTEIGYVQGMSFIVVL